MGVVTTEGTEHERPPYRRDDRGPCLGLRPHRPPARRRRALIGRPTDPDDIATLKAAGLICLEDYFPGGIHEEFPDPAWGYGITPIGRKYVAGLAD